MKAAAREPEAVGYGIQLRYGPLVTMRFSGSAESFREWQVRRVETREMTCIVCPMGCQMEVDVEGGEVLAVRNNQCARGPKYAREEVSDPRRVLTTTVRVVGNWRHVTVPVRTVEAIPKLLLGQAMKQTAAVLAQPPISKGQVIIPNVADSGVDLVASRSIPADEGLEA